MSIIVRCCFCGRLLKAPTEAAGRRAECPFCGKAIDVAVWAPGDKATSPGPATPQQPAEAAAETASGDIENFLDPPASPKSGTAATAAVKNLTWHRMFEALLDPRSI